MQSTSWESLGWKKHKLESKLMEEISITSDMQMVKKQRHKRFLLQSVEFRDAALWLVSPKLLLMSLTDPMRSECREGWLTRFFLVVYSFTHSLTHSFIHFWANQPRTPPANMFGAPSVPDCFLCPRDVLMGPNRYKPCLLGGRFSYPSAEAPKISPQCNCIQQFPLGSK